MNLDRADVFTSNTRLVGNCSNNATGPHTIFAAHLDADRQAALYDEICALGAQAWMTGTGPELFSDLGKRAQYVEVTETDAVSEVRRI